jgi:diguanylate cyclase (GGDEF)-like protein
MLLTDRAIVPLSPLQQMLASVALVLLTTLAVTAPTSRRWLIACLLLPLPLLSSLVLLRGFHVWYAPVCALSAGLVLLLGWGLWQARYWRRQANHDPLTGLANRMRFEGILRLETDAARRSGKPLTLMLIDVDHFKAYNDTHGHHLGDQMLRQVAQAIGDIARRPRDVAARFGGDEFALILPDTPQEGALALVQQLITTVRHMSLPIGKGRTARTSVTVGIYSVVPGIHDTASALYQAADAALYTAKEAGRDGYHAATP